MMILKLLVSKGYNCNSFYKNLKQEYSVLFLKVLFIIQDSFETCLSFSCQWLCIMITDKSFLKNFERKVTKNVLF